MQPQVVGCSFALFDLNGAGVEHAGPWQGHASLERLYHLSTGADFMVVRRRVADAYRAALVRETFRAFDQLPTSAHEPVIADTSYPWAQKNDRWILVPGPRARLRESLRECVRRWHRLDVARRVVDPTGTLQLRRAGAAFDWRPTEERR